MSKAIQEQIDLLASVREYWRALRGLLLCADTKDTLMILKKRIDTKAEEYVCQYDQCDPNDPVSIARAQEGRRICKAISSEFDAGACTEQIGKLDEKIKAMTKKRDGAKQSGGFGYVCPPE